LVLLAALAFLQAGTLRPDWHRAWHELVDGAHTKESSHRAPCGHDHPQPNGTDDHHECGFTATAAGELLEDPLVLPESPLPFFLERCLEAEAQWDDFQGLTTRARAPPQSA